MVQLHTMYEAERKISIGSMTVDGGSITVPYLTWSPGVTQYPCEAMLLVADAESTLGDRKPCGRLASDEVHAKLEFGSHHEYLASAIQPGMFLTLDSRLGYDIPKSLTPDEAATLVRFLADAIAIGAGYASIGYTKRKMPFRG